MHQQKLSLQEFYVDQLQMVEFYQYLMDRLIEVGADHNQVVVEIQ